MRFSEMGAELLRGWVAGWQIFLNMFILGWVGIAMGKLCAYLFGWDLWIGLVVFTTISNWFRLLFTEYVVLLLLYTDESRTLS